MRELPHGLDLDRAETGGLNAAIVMPENASPIKVEGTRRLGAEVILHGDINAAWALMHRLVEERGLLEGFL